MEIVSKWFVDDDTSIEGERERERFPSNVIDVLPTLESASIEFEGKKKKVSRSNILDI